MHKRIGGHTTLDFPKNHNTNSRATPILMRRNNRRGRHPKAMRADGQKPAR